MQNIPFQIIQWQNVPQKEHTGEQGTSFWQTCQYDGLRIRMVQYQPGYLADHWCQKGHIVHCLQGSFDTQMENGETFTLTSNNSYVVSDNMSSHRSYSKNGVTLLIVDGEFLQSNKT